MAEMAGGVIIPFGNVLLVAIVCTIILGGIDFGFSEFVKWLITAVKGA